MTGTPSVRIHDVIAYILSGRITPNHFDLSFDLLFSLIPFSSLVFCFCLFSRLSRHLDEAARRANIFKMHTSSGPHSTAKHSPIRIKERGDVTWPRCLFSSSVCIPFLSCLHPCTSRVCVFPPFLLVFHTRYASPSRVRC